MKTINVGMVTLVFTPEECTFLARACSRVESDEGAQFERMFQFAAYAAAASFQLGRDDVEAVNRRIEAATGQAV